MEKELFSKIIREGGVVIPEEMEKVRNMFPSCVTSKYGDVELEVVLIKVMLNVTDRVNEIGMKLYSITLHGCCTAYTTDKEFLSKIKEYVIDAQNIVVVDNIGL